MYRKLLLKVRYTRLRMFLRLRDYLISFLPLWKRFSGEKMHSDWWDILPRNTNVKAASPEWTRRVGCFRQEEKFDCLVLIQGRESDARKFERLRLVYRLTSTDRTFTD